MTLYETKGQLRQVSIVTGLYPEDTWSGKYASYTRLACKGGTLTVGLQSDPGIFTKPQTIVARDQRQAGRDRTGAGRRRPRLRRPAAVGQPGLQRRLRGLADCRAGDRDQRVRTRTRASSALHFSRFIYKPA